MNAPFVGDAAWLEIAQEVLRLKDEIDKMLKQRRELESKLRILSNDETTQVGYIKYEKIMRAGAVQYNKIPQLQGVDLDAYRKEPVATWKFTLGNPSDARPSELSEHSGAKAKKDDTLQARIEAIYGPSTI